ncbi:transcription repressor OFP8-like [Sesamum indicum]|uniref:Transcription repressor n=1 Tax=Sesamum indicum TaxID=4182 RepID=A0A6I9TCD6_SESIN|nr:transcription repressor OFP8-like [Sesamum indicum]
MYHHNLKLKVCRLLPSSFSSCQFRTLPDVVADTSTSTSIPVTKTNKIPPDNDHSSPSFAKAPTNCYPKKRVGMGIIKLQDQCRNINTPLNHHSSSSNSGRWFSSSDEKTGRPPDDFETETFFSLSSNSGDSFRLKTSSRRLRTCQEMESIDETGRCSSFSSINSLRRKTATTACGKSTTATVSKKKSSSKTFPESELPGSDQVFTDRLYYSNNRDSGRSFRRRKTAKNRRRIKKTPPRSWRCLNSSSMIEDCYAVEKSSSDPRSDFRESMVEMIVEKQMFGAEDLERLLLCFLSLNAASYHGMIFDVFSEICQTLFSN